MKPRDVIQNRAVEFRKLCQAHQVKTLYAFGSSITDRFNEETSDIDLLVEIDEPDPIKHGEKLWSFWDKAEQFFGREVDLLTPRSVKNPILLNEIQETKILLYDGEREKILF